MNMKINKYRIILGVVFFWIFTSITLYMFDSNYGIAISNIICAFILVLLTSIKIFNKKFANWLDSPIK